MQEGRWGDIWQFFNLEWGKNQRAKAVPLYAAAWIAMVANAVGITLTDHPEDNRDVDKLQHHAADVLPHF